MDQVQERFVTFKAPKQDVLSICKSYFFLFHYMYAWYDEPSEKWWRLHIVVFE